MSYKLQGANIDKEVVVAATAFEHQELHMLAYVHLAANITFRKTASAILSMVFCIEIDQI